MKYPMINKQPRREVNVPQLSGGLNLRDSLTGVRDNQMTDCVNMWYKDGMLRTRPGFVTNEDMYATSIKAYEDVYVADIQSHPQVKNGEAMLVSYIDCDGGFEHGNWLASIKFIWQYPYKTVWAGSVDFDGLREEVCKSKDELETQVRKSSRLVFEKDGYVYLFLNENGSFRVYKSQIADSLSWDYVDNDEYYVPTVLVHCQRNGVHDFKGTMFEGYNILSNKYKMIYSAYNENDSDYAHPMRYKMANPLSDDFVGNITAEITVYDSSSENMVTVTHSVHIDGTSQIYDYYEPKGETRPKDGLLFYAKKNYVGFLEWDKFGATPGLTAFCVDTEEKKKIYGLIEDNLVITLPYEGDSKSKKKIFNMTQNIWFGGAANGINGGSRLFLCGNTDENEKSLVVWSGLNNPLYFPENNYAYVGDKSQGAIAFGQQGENLIIFKEKSTYYSYYAVNDNISADDLINQSVVDYEANSVYFPIIQLNANIGCDCPGTVQLCRNRLVWANSDGNVYTLYSNNQYSERTIYKVSDMVSLALGKENDLKNAVSCDFEGHYLLCVGNRIYVMDYNSYGYQYAASFSKNEDSNAQIPWYVWEIGDAGYFGKLFVIDNRPMLMNSFQTSDGVMITFSVLSADENSGKDMLLFSNSLGTTYIYENKIKSRLQTKLFDFSAAGYLKNIDRASVGFGNNGGDPIRVSFITDKGSKSDAVTLCGSATEKRDVAFVTVKNFYPTTRSVRTFGVKIECDGLLVVDGLSLQYRLLGEIK